MGCFNVISRRLIGFVGVAVVCLPVFMLAPPFVREGRSELLTRDGLSSRSEYLARVEALVAALVASDRSAASEFRSLVVTLDAALRDLRVREAGERSGKVLPPPALTKPDVSGGAAEPKPLDKIPDDWLLKTIQDARASVERLAQDLDRGEGLSSPRMDRNVAEIAGRVARISRPE